MNVEEKKVLVDELLTWLGTEKKLTDNDKRAVIRVAYTVIRDKLKAIKPVKVPKQPKQPKAKQLKVKGAKTITIKTPKKDDAMAEYKETP